MPAELHVYPGACHGYQIAQPTPPWRGRAAATPRSGCPASSPEIRIFTGRERHFRLSSNLDGSLPQARRGQLDRALPAARDRPVSYEDCVSPEFYEDERDAVFQRAWLNVGRVEDLPRNGSYFTKEIEVANTSIIVVRDLRRRGARVPQHLPPPRQQAGVERLPGEETSGIVPRVHLQVPRVALRARRRVHLRATGGASSSTSTRPTTGSCRCTATCGPGSSS